MVDLNKFHVFGATLNKFANETWSLMEIVKIAPSLKHKHIS